MAEVMEEREVMEDDDSCRGMLGTLVTEVREVMEEFEPPPRVPRRRGLVGEVGRDRGTAKGWGREEVGGKVKEEERAGRGGYLNSLSTLVPQRGVRPPDEEEERDSVEEKSESSPSLPLPEWEEAEWEEAREEERRKRLGPRCEGAGEKTSVVEAREGRRGVGGMMKGEWGRGREVEGAGEESRTGGRRIWMAWEDRLVGERRCESGGEREDGQEEVGRVEEERTGVVVVMLTDDRSKLLSDTACALRLSGSFP